ncbi:1,2-phenylacetyl-CoA epoxidase subunit PaaD [Pseudobacter ginsenosidimutans]|uniref:Ring-1,2-phenylacetyl-CoA epoxidase subunit PaaD n=1 Tax=Pseudobacter ginsenosidimutans TaxID=661488 RepID=A0A4Q7MSJ6_9BACT|nr:1,2-phenylacetyl-CoA epoxidase subunit PaaD [Pseudobacter ginsenosidimutans]QEC41639.1 phenylacetate-CoA oxygenase subunit PaaJ [Pseudobacter ginsenosidimutans]RZS71567.1 ring-1,2-phenylacetyl-CoA epoxidase subunit PaaD [Pseudobacter ginsenosidimutans]
MSNVTDISTRQVWELLEAVTDPEVPVLTILDLGIVRDVKVENGTVTVVITPTYSGCPAMDVISMSIRMQLLSHGYKQVNISQVLSPAWTTDWMSEAGKEKLRAYGIAPPNPTQSVCSMELFADDEAVQCPHCSSWNTRRISEFGSTACKSLFQCNDCHEPFDYFKCH